MPRQRISESGPDRGTLVTYSTDEMIGKVINFYPPNYFRYPIFVLTLVLASCSLTLGQRNSPVDELTKPMSCEGNAVFVERLASAWRENQGLLILIARPGQRDTKKDLNKRRLLNVSTRLKFLGVSDDSIITAEAEAASAYGGIEFYFGGKKFVTLSTWKNSDLCVTCCGPDDRYYPDKVKISRNKGKRRPR